MSISMISLNTLTLKEWHSLLSNEKEIPDPMVQKDINGDGTRVYQVYAQNKFELNGVFQAAGTYFIRADATQVQDLSDLVDTVTKLSFSELVFLSDNFSTFAVSGKKEIEDLVLKGGACDYFESALNSSGKGLESIRKKVWTKHFDDQGVMGFIYRFFSAIANVFRKYGADDLIETPIYWPGNSCHYADQVVKQLNRIKKVFVFHAYSASKKVLSERLKISLEKLEDLNEEGKLKKLYYNKCMQFHPDKTLGDSKAADYFIQIKSAWNDFTALQILSEEFPIEAGDLSHPSQDKLGSHQYKFLL